MAYFLPSFFQKRLLRYALSRLELVDTDDLDLDSLGIRWGQRSTVELRDIGLKLEKLATLLHLPRYSELCSARVRLLRITIPADIYSSGILFEASGIDVHLRLPLETGGIKKDGKSTARKSHPTASDNTDHDPILPNPADLAESFLEAEPKEEKEELQAAISSQSQVLQRASSSSSDEEEELGVGNETVSLPSFVAAFLKGVVERLQVQVEDVSIRVDVETKQDGPSKRQPEEKPDLITGILAIRQINVDAVSRIREPEEGGSHWGKRLISISDINLALVSDPTVFSNYSRFTAPPLSPSTTIQCKSSQPPSRVSTPALPDDPSDSTPCLAMTQSTIFESPQEFSDPGIEPSHGPGMEESTYTYDGRFSDADTEEARSYGHLGESNTFSDDERILDNPDYLNSVIDSHLQGDDLESSEMLYAQDPEPFFRSEDTPRPDDSRLQGGVITREISDSQSSDRPMFQDFNRSPSPSQTHLEPHIGATDSELLQALSGEDIANIPRSATPPRSARPPSKPDISGSTSSSFGDADLSESKIFSHEEAESMYMSAISHESTPRNFMPNIPGAWDYSPESTVVKETGSYGRFSAAADVSDDCRVHKGQDETTLATPKLKAQTSSYISENYRLEESQQASPEGTDKGSCRSSPSSNKVSDVAKKFFSVDKISIWIPSVDNSEEPTENATASHEDTASGNFKDSTTNLRDYGADDDLLASQTHSSIRLRSPSIDSSFSHEKSEPRTPHRLADGVQAPLSPSRNNETEVEINSAEAQFDISIGWLVAKVGQRMLDALGNRDEEPRESRHQEAQGNGGLSLILNKISIKFVEHVPGQTYPIDNSRVHSPTFFGLLHEDVILQTTASGSKAHFSSEGNTTNFHLNITKFTFGFASENLISFSEDLKMRESIRDVLSPLHGDISFSLTKSPESARINIATLPLQLSINVLRLEEVLSWFGGLSTILELGNSISSVSGVRGSKKEVPKRPRGVHFETSPAPVEPPQQESIQWKMNARVGGIVLDLIGETHFLKLRTTAVKVVSRHGVIAVQIDKAKLSGPLSLAEARDAPVKVNFTNIRIEYLNNPAEVDLDRLLYLITPSKDKYDEDDDIMLDTLLSQRRQGSVLRTTINGANIIVSHIPDLAPLSQLGDEVGRLSNVTKYLPQDDRPGILTLTLVRDFEARVHVGGQVGHITGHLKNAEVAYISIPSLVAAQLGSITVIRNGHEELVGEALPLDTAQTPGQSSHPTLMMRFIADEMEPTVKVKVYNLRVEYTVPSMIAFLGLGDDMTAPNVASNMANSLVNLAELQTSPQDLPSPTSSASPKEHARPIKLAVSLRDSVLGLNPRGTTAKGLLVLTNARFSGAIHDPDSSEAKLELRKASIMVIDDVNNMQYSDNLHRGRFAAPQSSQVLSFIGLGYVPVSTISSATATISVMRLSDDDTKSLDVELRDDLLILETCADSTQTLISIVNGLQPPTPPSVTAKYRTEVLPLQDMLSSLSGDAFATGAALESDQISEEPSDLAQQIDVRGGRIEDELEYVSEFYPVKPGSEIASLHENMGGSGSNELLDSFHSQYYVSSSVSELDFREDHFAQQSAVGGTAHRWDSTQNTYGLSDDSKLQKSPLRIRVRDAHVIWNLFDGYDWQRTRDTISKAVKDVEKRVTERRARVGSRASPGSDEEESVIGDCLFNSIYIGIPANKDPRELRNDINHNIDDLASETGSYATSTTVTGATARQSHSPSFKKKLRLSRSKYHKMTFELKGICADLVVFPPESGETQSSLDVRVNDLEIFDHVPTSTWKKFATYMHEAGEKESGTSMVHLEILTVRPVPELAASEIVLKATILPLRLHVDQDALDFLCRFFEFRDDSAPASSTPPDIPFLQRAEVNAVPVKLDFKPKRVDYAGLRSGRTTEFMNFFVLDGADMVMRHVIIYGVSGFDKLGQTLNDIWMPDIKRNQLPGVLAGLAPIRSLVNVGGGVKDLVVIPMREYRKDGRIVRSIQKGALSFAKTTSNELIKLGAKLAIGTQTVLQGAEDMLNPSHGSTPNAEEDLTDEEEAKKISLYADQPIGVVQGLRGGYRGLERDLLLARDAIVAVPGEVMDSGSATAAAKAVWKRAPTVVLRPAIGVTKAFGQTLLGAGNTLDPSNRRKVEDKYKRH
ncbi:autophagy- protein 2 [Aspergillus nanangensis]|uniref:Autophagy-related protein 2 n=1 Tax=Aspergillus nanangensis TaxID=2582783 RepID=A0AAD4CG68_ASPNN|nr:autophagy- protein 2 [Aspergillus nanangensis]